MRTLLNCVKLNLNEKKLNFDNLKMNVLNKNEMVELNGGSHYEWIDGKFVEVY